MRARRPLVPVTAILKAGPVLRPACSYWKRAVRFSYDRNRLISGAAAEPPTIRTEPLTPGMIIF